MKEAEKRPTLRIFTNENGQTVGFFINNPGAMPRDALTEFIRYQLEGVQQRLITIYQNGQRIIIEPTDLERLRKDYKKEELQELTVSTLGDSAARSRGFLVMDPDPIFS